MKAINWSNVKSASAARPNHFYRSDNGLDALRIIARDGYAWPGGYELFAVTTDGAVLCRDCVRKEYPAIYQATVAQDRSGWAVAGCSADCECNGPVYCDHCGRDIVPDPGADDA